MRPWVLMGPFLEAVALKVPSVWQWMLAGQCVLSWALTGLSVRLRVLTVLSVLPRVIMGPFHFVMGPHRSVHAATGQYGIFLCGCRSLHDHLCGYRGLWVCEGVHSCRTVLVVFLRPPPPPQALSNLFLQASAALTFRRLACKHKLFTEMFRQIKVA